MLCEIVVDDNGDTVGTNHSRISIEDKTRKDALGNTITSDGLRSMFTNDRAGINVDGKLELDGQVVTP